jgi:hypothetical protein
MAQTIVCSNKNELTIEALLLASLVKNFQGAEAEEAGTFNALNLIHVEDSGEDYFCDNKNVDMEILSRKLFAVDTNENTGVRVSFGTSETPFLACDPSKNWPMDVTARSIIGKGTDGEPLIRLVCANLPAIS